MDEEKEGDSHARCVVHVDVDCFYAQVEELRKPELRGEPLGVRQKNLVVTANYVARRRGVGKCVAVEEALQACPELRLVRGEDLRPYRAASDKLFLLMQSFQCPVERVGLDESFLDVTAAAAARLAAGGAAAEAPAGRVWGSSAGGVMDVACGCGCRERLVAASHVAADIRRRVREELGLTCSAGIAHNKLLAKLAGAAHKPNDQTLLFPESAHEFMLSLPSVRSIPGVGPKTVDSLAVLGVASVADLRRVPLARLQGRLGAEVAARLQRQAWGVDNVEVRTSGRPASIGLEDSGTVSVRGEVEERFSALLARLAASVREDGRVPVALRVTLRKKDARRAGGHRESRTCQLPPGLFTGDDTGAPALLDAGRRKLLALVMRLFDKLVDFSKPFHLTLLGLAFTKFQERASGRGSILNYLMNDLSVQSVLSLRSECETSVGGECTEGSGGGDGACAGGAAATEAPEGEEPSPKKVKRAAERVAKRRCVARSAASPSKLRVGELRLDSHELDQVAELRLSSRESDSSEAVTGAGADVVPALPPGVQRGLQLVWTNTPAAVAAESKPNTILRYFIPNK